MRSNMADIPWRHAPGAYVYLGLASAALRVGSTRTNKNLSLNAAQKSIQYDYFMATSNPGHHSINTGLMLDPLDVMWDASSKASQGRPGVQIATAIAAGDRRQMVVAIPAKVDCFLYPLA